MALGFVKKKSAKSIEERKRREVQTKVKKIVLKKERDWKKIMDEKACLRKVFQKYARRKWIYIEPSKYLCEITRAKFDAWLYDKRLYFERKRKEIPT